LHVAAKLESLPPFMNRLTPFCFECARASSGAGPFSLAALLAGLLLLPSSLQAASDWSVKVVEKAPPAGLDESFRQILKAEAVQLSKGADLAFEFWFAKEIPLSSKPDSLSMALAAVPQAGPLGAVRVPSDLRDYRDDELFADLYTIRMGFQPQDGDHLGTSEFTYFMVLIPAKVDRTPAGITDYKTMVKASGKDTPSGHPVILSLRPIGEEAGELPAITEPAADHVAARVKLSGKVRETGEEVPLVFDLVCEGHSAH
jgi:hypothetical protein